MLSKIGDNGDPIEASLFIKLLSNSKYYVDITYYLTKLQFFSGGILVPSSKLWSTEYTFEHKHRGGNNGLTLAIFRRNYLLCPGKNHFGWSFWPDNYQEI